MAPSTSAAPPPGRLWAWGANHLGQMGTGPGFDQPAPQPVPGLPLVRAVCANASAVLALDAHGQAWSWGWNTRGMLGRGRPADEKPYWLPTVLRDLGHRNTDPAGNPPGPEGAVPPGDADELPDALQALFGDIPMHITPAPVMEGVCAPAPIAGLPPVVQIALTSDNGFALDAEGAVWAWGAGGRMGLPLPKGLTLPPPALAPVRVAGLPPVSAIAAHPGGDTVYALDAQGTVWSWGSGYEGELGHGKRRVDPVPAPIAGLGPVRAVCALGNAALAVLQDGQVWGWGSAEDGVGFEPPKKNTWRVLAPVPVAGLPGPVRRVWTGQGLTLYRLEDGSTWACGVGLRAVYPQDAGEPPRVPRRQADLDGWADFFLGSDHGFAVDGAGRVAGFGRVEGGALGPSDVRPDVLQGWTALPLPHPARALAAGGHHSLGILAQ